jgi:hypothetical protein
MYTFRTTNIRPNTEVEFYQPSAAYSAWFKNIYIDPGIVNFTQDLSENGLELEYKYEWLTYEAFLRFLNSATLKQALVARDKYNSDNGIVVTRNPDPAP